MKLVCMCFGIGLLYVIYVGIYVYMYKCIYVYMYICMYVPEVLLYVYSSNIMLCVLQLSSGVLHV